MKRLLTAIAITCASFSAGAEEVACTIEQEAPSLLHADGLNKDGSGWSAVSTQTVIRIEKAGVGTVVSVVIDDGTTDFWIGKGKTFTASIAPELFNAVMKTRKKNWLKASEITNRKNVKAPNQQSEGIRR